MSPLAALAHAYERMAERGEVPPFGYSTQKIAYVIALNADGSSAAAPAFIGSSKGSRQLPRPMAVPQPVKRTSAVAPNFLWDKTSYALGVTAGTGKRVAEEHAAFVQRHVGALRNTDDEGLKALRLFLETWTPARFEELGWPEEMKDQNVVFTLESERLQNRYIHDRPAAKELWARVLGEDDAHDAICLVTGDRAPVARLHPSIKGVWGAQSAGASLVSFNLDAFTSYGHEQGDNAPVSQSVAFAYTTALNKFLESGSPNRLQIGDASTVFWADASDATVEKAAQSVFLGLLDETKIDETMQAERIGDILAKLRQGRPLKSFAPDLAEGVRFYVLGLSPNAARLSLRFWMESDFGAIAEKYQRFLDEMRLEPAPRHPNAPLWHYLAEMAVLKKSDNIPPNLAGEWLRSILMGTNYPWTLLSSVLMRLRSDRDVSDYRVAILKAVLIRNFDMEDAPVALDPDNRNKGYLLGRLFAAYEYAQFSALGGNVNATIKDKFYGAASAQPRKVFAMLGSGAANHLSRLGKESPGTRIWLEDKIGGIMDLMAPDGAPFPAFLPAEQQALFGLGYYHQRNDFFKRRTPAAENEKEAS